MRILRRVPWFATTGLLLAAILAPHLGSGLLADTNPPARSIRSSPSIEPTFAVQAGIEGEIFPALANYASLQRAGDRDFGTFAMSVSNSNSVLNARISLEVRGWSDVELQNVSLGAGEVRKLLFAPVFWPRLYTNHEIAAATAIIKVTDFGNHLLHEETVPVRLRSVDDMYWGPNFKFAAFIASWVTPHDPAVEGILSKAKEFMPGRRLPGYEEWKSADQQAQMTREEARAIYRAVQASGVSYVKSSLTFGQNSGVSERVRMPGESLHQFSANCIDGVVMYASLFENLNMDAVVVLVPGHAYVGVRESADSNSYLYLETAITGRASFDAAVKAASRGIAKVAAKNIIRIPVSEARTAGIYPMPLPGQDLRHFPSVSPSAEANSPGR